MTEEAESILEACGMTEDQISLPPTEMPPEVPRAVVPTFKSNWPVKPAAHSSFEKALLGEGDADEESEEEGDEAAEVENEEEEVDIDD